MSTPWLFMQSRSPVAHLCWGSWIHVRFMLERPRQQPRPRHTPGHSACECPRIADRYAAPASQGM